MTGSDPRCQDVLDRLTAALRKGEEVSAEDRQHVAACPECNRVLAAATELHDALAADAPASGSDERFSRVAREAEAAAIRAEKWRRATFIILGALAVVIPWLASVRVLFLQVFGALVGLGAVGTLVLQRVNAGTGGAKIYKRIKGQWIFGVCRGMAETAGIPVWVLRIGLVALMLIGKTGVAVAFALYFLFDFSLEVHPEDRGMLYRFRIKRWLKSRKTSPRS